jgi:predicted ATPase
MTVLPNSAVQNSFAKDEMESTIDFFEASTVRVDSQPTNRYDQLDKVIQESEKRDTNRAKEKEETLNEMAHDKKKKVNMSAEMEDMKDANAPTQAEMLSGANKQPDSGPRDFINMTTRSNTIGSFVEKMNSPPIWRTVLG